MRYAYKCTGCETEETRNVPIDDRDNQSCTGCGAALKRIFEPTATVLIPPYMTAEFSHRKQVDPRPTSDLAKKNWSKNYDIQLMKD